ncbi:hypothetical protein WMF18_30785 [Sorangium sp. So ce315]|uniref:hypothetical protein n=1 Tax=Sorangium sp. So ce315 TaxID=3133299 RepID=UPI003F61F75D
MAFMLGATAFSAGCGDDSGGGGTGGGTTASSTTSSSATTGTGGEGGGGEGGGEGVECVTCSKPLLEGADTADLCAVSEVKYTALTECICGACGAAEGDPCYAECTMGGESTEECSTCGTMAATTEGGACAAEGTTCLDDTGECVTCSAPLLQGADKADLCPSSVPKYTALTACICEACGAAEGDPCYDVCSPEGGEQSDECTACGTMVATTAEGACAAEGTTCLQDMPE